MPNNAPPSSSSSESHPLLSTIPKPSSSASSSKPSSSIPVPARSRSSPGKQLKIGQVQYSVYQNIRNPAADASGRISPMKSKSNNTNSSSNNNGSPRIMNNSSSNSPRMTNSNSYGSVSTNETAATDNQNTSSPNTSPKNPEPLNLKFQKNHNTQNTTNSPSHNPYPSSSSDSDEELWTQSLWATSNIAIIASYFCVGFTASFMATPLSCYMIKELSAQPAEQNTIGILMSVPWSFKLVYGFTSDTFKLFGYRRKSYLLLGYIIYAFSMLTLAFLKFPSVLQLAICLFTGTIGLIMADVSADTIIVERSKFEPEYKRGQSQATCYSVRFFGGIIGSVGGCLLYNREAWGWGLRFDQVCLLNGLLPLAILIPAIPSLYELEAESKSVRAQIDDIWRMVQLKAVWKPMSFIYIYNLLQVPNVAWGSYLQLTLEFPPWFIGFVGLVGSMMTFFGIVAYKRFFFKSSWRSIYVLSGILTTLFSCLQLCLIFQINTKYFHISDYPFAMGDDVIQQFLSGVQFLPSCIMYMTLCPKGSEGATYSMLTTFGNIAMVVAGSIGSRMGDIWDVSNSALRAHDLRGLWKLALVTSLLPMAPLVLVGLLPKDQKSQKKLQKSKESSFIGGVVFLLVLAGSLVGVLINACTVLMKCNEQTKLRVLGLKAIHDSGGGGGGDIEGSEHEHGHFGNAWVGMEGEVIWGGSHWQNYNYD